ncbi:anion permease [Streptomyces sp. 4N509B]|uniref:inorganic phosphate transporter n=1 Tax=Streptomyces sp. 4N509B TaxID=3457413 RepID=UPI003FD4EDCC
MDTLALIAVVATALFFAYSNGFHDSSHAVSTSVSTRALTPRVALVMAAFMNLAGGLLGTSVAETVSEDLVATPADRGDAMALLLAALLAAIAWTLAAARLALPSSSSHALLGGLLGAALVHQADSVHWHGVLTALVLPMVIAPLVALVLGYAVMLAILWIFRRSAPRRAQHGFRIAQTASAAAMSLGHGLQDAQKAMAVVVMALVAADVEAAGTGVPLWVRISCAVMIALGTYVGGWSLMRTLGRRIIALDPPRGFAAESAATGVLHAASFVFTAPVSTTHVVASSVVGVGATRRFTAVRWGVARSVVGGWIVTVPASAAVAGVGYAALSVVPW